jgi:hypothetical protein
MAIQTFTGRIRQRFSTLAVIEAANPILLEGEVWIEKDPSTGRSTGRRKVGDGQVSGDVITGTAFNDLPFEPGVGGVGSGDVVGPSISVDGRAVVFDGTTGKRIRQAAAAPVLEGDGRLTDARTPTTHAASHGDGGSDEITVSQDQVTGLGTALAGKADTSSLATVATTGAYGDLSGRPTLGTAAATDATSYAPAAEGVTGGDSHDHSGGDGAQIAYGSLSGLPTLGTAAAAGTGDFAPAGHVGSGGTAHPNAVASGAAGFMTGADKAKLNGVAANATANATDAALRDRATHTGTQAASTITGLATVATSGAYGDLSGRPTLGTAAAADTGTGAGDVVALDGSARLPAVDGSQLTNLPSGASSLDGLSDVVITTPSTDQVLKYDGTNWVNGATAGGGDALTSGTLAQFASTTSDQLRGVISDETGTGAAVFGTEPTIDGMRRSVNSSVAAGTNAQGQGMLTADVNVITSSAANPGAVTLPPTPSGRRVTIVNRTGHNVVVYPGTGHSLDGGAANAAVTLGNTVQLVVTGASATEWFSTRQELTNVGTLFGTGSGIIAFLQTPSSANLAGAVTDETGSGPLVFGTSPTLVTPALGTPSSGTLTNCTGLPAAGVTGLGSLATQSAIGSISSAGAIGSTANLPIITGASGVLGVGSFGTTASTFCEGNDSRLSDARTPLSHTHGNISNAGAIGSTSGLPIITGASGVLQAGSFGTTAGTFAEGNDSRLSDARTPTAHNQAWSTITSTPTTLSGYGITDAQPLDSDLTSIAALTTTTFGRSFLDRADAAAGRTHLGLGTLATQSGTFSGTSSGTNTGDQTIGNTSDSTSHTVTLSASGGTVQFVEGANITLTTTGTGSAGVVTIAGTASGGGFPAGNITSAGAIGTTSGLPIITGTDGVLQAGAFGDGAGEFAEGDDPRFDFYWVIALSDLETPLTTGTKERFIVERGFTLTQQPLWTVDVAPTSAAIEAGIDKNASTIYSTEPQIDATTKRSALSVTTSAFLASASTYSFAAGDEIEFSLIQVGATIAGAGMKVHLRGRWDE